ncbi:ABC transporter permease [Aeromicrobium sp. CTD01-1L150]|uniref:ABC transporter permease n=1 Tax=Aeromicrobium sp. CTD01-1L150 TaxID=3341830 RepID=UPI0035C18377
MSTATTIADARAMSHRSLLRAWREPDAFFMALFLPVVLIVLFVYVFGGAMDTGVAYENYVVPGLIVLCAGYGAGSTAISLAHDLDAGVIDRFRSMPISAGSVIVGHVVASVARNVVATTLVIAVGLLVGWRPTGGPLAWLAAVGLILLFIVAVSWLCAALGLLVKTPEAATSVAIIPLFLPYLSTAFVPAETLPAVLRGFAEHQPYTPVIETLRGLWMGTPLDSHPWWAIGWCLVTLAVAAVAGARLFARRVG